MTFFCSNGVTSSCLEQVAKCVFFYEIRQGVPVYTWCHNSLQCRHAAVLQIRAKCEMQRWMPVDDSKAAINATICHLELVVLEGLSLPGWSVNPFTGTSRWAGKGSIFSFKNHPEAVERHQCDQYHTAKGKASGTSRAHMCTPETRRSFEKSIRRYHGLIYTSQNVKMESENERVWAANLCQLSVWPVMRQDVSVFQTNFMFC